MIIIVKEGEKYGKLTTLYVSGKNKHRAKIWHCICDCGNEIDVPSTSLTSGNTKSCGCLVREKARINGEKSRIHNRYDLNGDYGIGYTSKGEEFYFDKEDFDKIKSFTWHINHDGYVTSTPFGKIIKMHMLIMNSDGKHRVDHINHVPRDNRKNNLRVIEHYQNIIYSKTYSNNTSGRKGVYWDKSRNKWMAAITFNKKTINLGRFDTFEEAKTARINAEKNIHKEFHYED